MNKENKYKLKPFLLSLFMKNKIISLSIKNNRNLVKTYRKLYLEYNNTKMLIFKTKVSKKLDVTETT